VTNEDDIKINLKKYKGWLCWKEGMDEWQKIERIFES